ncbi:hypothetical protein [Bordetella bronchiseptica]|uniref:hypothetical protein n=1 Tax=Bordetella bronchiseptica TaxID=518 RepID=UPI000461EF41|nr:hypothetical protein [Bordetella bronchiseptica]KDD42631.1 hypothetical protein L529_0485 [Bordetella bronchiseptica MBORD901]
MNAPTTPRKPLVVGWLYEGIVPPVFTDSVVIYREWLRQGHANISPVIRKSDADAYYIPDGEVRVECAPDPRGIGIGAWVGSRCIYSGVHEIPAKTRDWAAINAAIDEYLDGYELRLDEGCHTPTEFERFLIDDAVAGLFEDSEILALLSDAPPPAAGDTPPRFTISASDRFELTGAVGLLRGYDCAGAADALQRVLDAESASFSVQGEDDARDARRYRWLCDKFGITKLPCAIERIIEGSYVADGKAAIDAAIDAAIAAQQGKGGEA